MDDIIYLNMLKMERTHWWYKGRREIIGKMLTPFLPNYSKILDAGCGAGGNMEFMGKYGSVVGIDISKEMIEHCCMRGLSATCGSIENTPFADGDFDVILCLDVLEHLPDEELVLRELKRVVRSGGIMVFSVPAFDWLWGTHDDQNNHFRRYNYRQVVRILKKADLTILRSTYFNFFLLPFIWCVRRLSADRLIVRQTDLELGAGCCNHILYKLLKLEGLLLNFTNLPVGVSQIVICRKK